MEASCERDTQVTIRRKKANQIDHILLRNCLRVYVIGGETEGRIEVTGRRRRRRKQLPDGFKRKTG